MQRNLEEIEDVEVTEFGEYLCRLETTINDLEDIDLEEVRAARPETRECELRDLNIAIGRLLSFRMELLQRLDSAA